MNQQNVCILFYLQKARINKKGTCPIRCRITYLRKRKEFGTGEFVKPTEWNPKQQKAISKSIASQQLNTQLQIIEGNIKKKCNSLRLSPAKNAVIELGNWYHLQIVLGIKFILEKTVKPIVWIQTYKTNKRLKLH